MTTPTQQDPIDRFTLQIEELRRMPGLRGPARLLHNLFLDLFLSLIRLLASLVEQARNGTLPDTAPARQAGAQGSTSPRPSGTPASPRAWPSDPWPSQSRCLEHRAREAACGGSTMHEPFEQPEMQEPIAEPPCRMPVVELPAALPQYADTGTTPPCRGAQILLTTDARFLRLFSKKWVLPEGNYCDLFVTI
jgi:hypothetical protein